MKAQEIRAMGLDELKTKQGELAKESFNLRMQHRLGQLDNPKKLTELRRDTARVKTIIAEKQRES